MSIPPLYSHILTHSSSPLGIELAGTALTHFLCFWLPSAVFLILTYTLSPTSKLRTQPTEPPPSLRELRQCVLVVLGNQCIGLLLQSAVHLVSQKLFGRPIFSILSHADNNEKAGIPGSGDDISATITWVFRTLILPIPICELIFYASHRMMHTRPSLYRRIHTIHHAFTAPIALAAQYSHPVEWILTAWVPIMFATAVVGSDLIGMWAFAGMVQFETAVVHSGLRVGELAERHDRHHEGGVIGGYATFEIVDWLFGTSMREVGLKKKRKMAEESKTLEADAVEERDVGSRKPVMKRTESSVTTGRGTKLPLGLGYMKILARWRGSERLGTRIENADR